MKQLKSKRILLLDIGAPFGGVESYILGLAELLMNEAQVFVICGLPKLAKGLRSLNVRVFCIPIVGSRLSNLIRFLVVAVVLPFLILFYRIDIVQVNGNLESLLVFPARLLGCFAIRTAHGASETKLYRWYRQPLTYFPRLGAAYSLRFASRVVCCSETVGKDVLRTVPPERVAIIPNWVRNMPTAICHPNSLRTPLNLLYLSRLERYKGLHLVLEAMRGLDGLRLTVVGEGEGNYRVELEKLAEGLDVRFEGWVPSTVPYHQSADLYVNPSSGPEGLPIASLEAMAYGLPCIFSSLPAHKEISDNGVAALIFRIGDAIDLRTKLSRLVADPDLRSLLSRNALAIVRERYSAETARQAYLKAFDLN